MCFKKLLTLALLVTPLSSAIAEDSFQLESERNKAIIRFELDNDTVWDSDSNFSNGVSLQYYTKNFSSWDNSDAFALYKWVGNTVPGLDPHGSVVRYGHSIGQNMITPEDIGDPHPPAGDLPYAGTLSYTANWQRYNENTGANFQVSLGLLGKASLAEQAQKFVHNTLGAGENPEGWDTQRDSEPLFNTGYQYHVRLAHFGTYDNHWAGQFEIAPAFSLGNLYTAAEVEAGFRFGWNMAKGFGVLAAPPVRGFHHAMEITKPVTASPHSIDFFIGARGTALLYSVFYDGSFITNDDRDVERDNFIAAALLSVNYHYYDTFAIRFFLQESTDFIDEDKLPTPRPGEKKTATNLSYGSISFEYYF